MGAACARTLAQKNYELVLMARSEVVEKLADTLGATAFRGSVTDPDDLKEVVDMTVEKHGRVDAVVNNTGHPPSGELLEVSDEDWHYGLDMVLMNVVRMARLVTPHMKKQGRGALVNISTFGAVEPSDVFPVSSALRSALSGFTKMFADKYASSNIRMNNILPGFIDSYEVDEDTLHSIPMNRPGSVDEIGETAAFLVSDEAGYITGQNIRVDGGLTHSI